MEADFKQPNTEQVENNANPGSDKDEVMSSGSLPQSGQAASPFSIEGFLKSAKIKEERISSYAKFLGAWGLDASSVNILTEEVIKNYSKEYKQEEDNSFSIVPADRNFIAEAASKFGIRGDPNANDRPRDETVREQVVVLTEVEDAWKRLLINNPPELVHKSGILSHLPFNFPNLYIRRDYELIQGIINEKKFHFHIKGTPGIGKSFFIVYMLYLRRQQLNSQTLYTDSDGSTYLLKVGSDIDAATVNLVTDKHQLVRLLVDQGCGENGMHLADSSSVVRNPKNKTVLVESPGRETSPDFSKNTNTMKMYLNPFDEAEILYVHQEIYSDIPLHDVKERYKKWGGIARIVFSATGTHVNEAEEKLGDADVFSLAHSEEFPEVVKTTKAASISHVVVHIRSTSEGLKPFTSCTYALASPAIKDYVSDKLKTYSLEQLAALVLGEKKSKLIKGVYFEEYAHRRLSEGGEFKIRKLDPLPDDPRPIEVGDDGDDPNDEDYSPSHQKKRKRPSKKEIKAPVEMATPFIYTPPQVSVTDIFTLPKFTKKIFGSLKDIEDDPNTYFIPNVPNWPTWDALIMRPTTDMMLDNIEIERCFLLQMTVSYSHKSSVRGFTELNKDLQAKSDLIFVVPDINFSTFRHQYFRGADLPCDQYVISIPLL